MNTQKSSPGLELRIDQPANQQVVALNSNVVVISLAIATAGVESHPIKAVTVQVGLAAPTNARLLAPPHPSAGTVAFDAIVSISGPTTITVKATDHAGRSVRQSVTVTTAYATPSERATPWQNYPRTLALTPYSVCRPRSLQDVVAIVQEAEAASKRVHAVGSGYSFSKSP